MWEFLARIGVILRSDIENKLNIKIVSDLKDIFYGLKTADELIEMLNEKKYLPEMNYEGWYVGSPVPNEETAFAVQSVNVLYTALCNGNTELAYEIAHPLLLAIKDSDRHKGIAQIQELAKV